MTCVILVPIKDPMQAKSRLSGLLDKQERFILVCSMLEDLARALLPLPCPVAMVTSSDAAAARAEALRWRVLREPEQVSESHSIDAASRTLEAEGADRVLRLPADIPSVTTSDIAELIEMTLPAPAAVLAPSHDRNGTNALLRMPPLAFPSLFGANSFARHLREAQSLGVNVRIVENPRLALDLDNPQDIAHFLAQSVDCETYRTLMSMNIEEKLAHYDRQIRQHTRA